jgi:hypothetical protein
MNTQAVVTAVIQRVGRVSPNMMGQSRWPLSRYCVCVIVCGYVWVGVGVQCNEHRLRAPMYSVCVCVCVVFIDYSIENQTQRLIRGILNLTQ